MCGIWLDDEQPKGAESHLLAGSRCFYLPFMVHAPEGGDSSTKLIGVMFSEVGRIEAFYGDSSAFMP